MKRKARVKAKPKVALLSKPTEEIQSDLPFSDDDDDVMKAFILSKGKEWKDIVDTYLTTLRGNIVQLHWQVTREGIAEVISFVFPDLTRMKMSRFLYDEGKQVSMTLRRG